MNFPSLSVLNSVLLKKIFLLPTEMCMSAVSNYKEVVLPLEFDVYCLRWSRAYKKQCFSQFLQNAEQVINKSCF